MIIECISCKSRGHVTLSAGDFTIDNDENADDSNDVDLIPDESFSSGFLEFTASEFSGRFELGIDFLAGTKAEVTLGKIPGLKLPNLKVSGLPEPGVCIFGGGSLTMYGLRDRLADL